MVTAAAATSPSSGQLKHARQAQWACLYLTCLGLLGRQQILEQYAQHLSAEELHQLASLTSGCSGRDLRDLCEQAERHWAAKVPLSDAVPSSVIGLVLHRL